MITKMSGIFCTLLGVLAMISTFLKRGAGDAAGSWLPSEENRAKREFEIYSLKYTAIWIGIFAVVIVFKLYEKFHANEYMILCVSLSLPFLLQPLFFPLPAEKNLPLTMRYSFKANVWIAIFSFIGNYWYTHYFYSVLGAKYTFEAHRLNDVPIALYFATHFYFVTYHTFSNMILRKVETRYKPSTIRSVFFWACVVCFAYFTAFMETLTISSFPYYSFQEEMKQKVYTIGSAFYGIYFIVSFPSFYRVDEKVSAKGNPPFSMHQIIFEVMGAAMIVLLMLDFCRLFLKIDLNIIGENAFYQYPRPRNLIVN